MATPSAIRDAIQTRLQTISGLRAFDLVNGKIPTPCAMVLPISYEKDHPAGGAWTFLIDVYVSANSLRAGQDELDGFLPGGANDIQAAIAADADLGGTVDDAVCDLEQDSYGLKEFSGVVYLGCEFTVHVYD